jgi:NADH-quinone oxidoreductase subunit N
MDGTAFLQGTGALVPHLTVLITGLVILTLDLFLTARSRFLNEVVGLAGLALAFVLAVLQHGDPRMVFMDMAVVDNLSVFFHATFILIALLTVLMSASFVRRVDIASGEYYALVLFATTGFMFVASAANLVMLFLAIETLSIATYILAGMHRHEQRSLEAAFKYFILGAFSSAIFLYGIATVYGALGHMNIIQVAATVAQGEITPLLMFGVALLIVGLGFKVAAVPFHMWAPDVYDGAPTAVTAFMSAGPKAAAFAALLRVFFQGFGEASMAAYWAPVFAVLAALTMILGNLSALQQVSIKRMLAYSSIAHAGYAFVALVTLDALGAASILYYMVAYTFMSLGAFAVLTVVAKRGERHHAFSDYSGLASTNPILAAVMTLFMFALAGFPPTAGFAGKFYVFSAAVKSGYYTLAIIGVLTSVVSIFYYIHVIRVMYMQEPGDGGSPIRVSATTCTLLGVTVLGTLYMGVFPGSILSLAERSVALLFS